MRIPVCCERSLDGAGGGSCTQGLVSHWHTNRGPGPRKEPRGATEVGLAQRPAEYNSTGVLGSRCTILECQKLPRVSALDFSFEARTCPTRTLSLSKSVLGCCVP